MLCRCLAKQASCNPRGLHSHKAQPQSYLKCWGGGTRLLSSFSLASEGLRQPSPRSQSSSQAAQARQCPCTNPRQWVYATTGIYMFLSQG